MSKKKTTFEVNTDRLSGMLLMPAKFDAAAPIDGKAQRFTMELYRKGYVFSGHWRFGNVVIDMASFKQVNQAIFALYQHIPSLSVGFTDKAGVEGDLIVASGQFYEGNEEQEPEAVTLQRRMKQGAPMQCSGGFVPGSIERIEAGMNATVDGINHVGPISIFRNASLVEASFAEMGWYTSATAKLAAEWPGETHQEKKSMTTNFKLLGSLKEIFGADKAIELLNAKADAADLTAFQPEIISALQAAQTEVTNLKASVSEKETKITSLEADIKAAKANPPLTGLKTGDGNKPPEKKPEGTDDLKAKWDGDTVLQAQFSSFEAYKGYIERYPEVK